MYNNNQVCNIDYDNELNVRIQKRYFPSQELQPNFDPRPVQTKYSQFHISNQKPSQDVPLRIYPTFNTKDVFFTGNRRAPVQYGLSQVDIESTLGNRYMALQKNDHAVYIPPLQSDLYAYPIETNMKKSSPNNFTPLYNKNMDKCNLAPKVFNNSTRYNVQNIK
jgi:hypothetical protein